jgi:hypothetical protein
MSDVVPSTQSISTGEVPCVTPALFLRRRMSVVIRITGISSFFVADELAGPEADHWPTMASCLIRNWQTHPSSGGKCDGTIRHTNFEGALCAPQT